MNKQLSYGIAGAAVLAVAIGAGVLIGKHTSPAYAADEPINAQTIAAEAGAPTVPGLCVLSQNAVYANAKVGQAATARYRELNADLRGQLAPQQQAIQEDAKKLQDAEKTMPAAQFQAKAQELAKQEQDFKLADSLDAKELEATRQKALRQIATYAQPVIADAYKARHCGALFSRDAMLVGNPGMDLTSMVVAGLDSKVTTISFALEKLPAGSSTTPQASQ